MTDARRRSALAGRSALAALALLSGCRSAAPSSGGAPTARVTPVPGFCGQRSAVAVSRARAPRRATRAPTGPGSLVVRLAPADDSLTPPEGPVRLASADSGAGVARQLTASGPGVLVSGPLAPGHYVVEANGTGYQPRRFTVAVRAGLTDTLRFRLAARCVRRD